MPLVMLTVVVDIGVDNGRESSWYATVGTDCSYSRSASFSVQSRYKAEIPL